MKISPAKIDEAAREEAAIEVGRLVNQIVKLAPQAGLYIGIKIEPASPSHHSGEGE